MGGENLALPSIKHSNNQQQRGRLNQNRVNKPIRVHGHLQTGKHAMFQPQHHHRRTKKLLNSNRGRSYLRDSGSGSKRSSQSPHAMNSLHHHHKKQQPVSARNQPMHAKIHSSKSHIKPYGYAPSSEQTKKIKNKFMDHELITDELKKEMLPTLSGRVVTLNRRKLSFPAPEQHDGHQAVNKFRFGKYKMAKRGHQPMLNNNKINNDDGGGGGGNRGNRFRRAGNRFLQ